MAQRYTEDMNLHLFSEKPPQCFVCETKSLNPCPLFQLANKDTEGMNPRLMELDVRCRAMREKLQVFLGLLPWRQNLALTVSCVPHLIDRGLARSPNPAP